MDGRSTAAATGVSIQHYHALLKEDIFAVTMQGPDKFDLYHSMSNVAVNDSGSYVAKLEVIHPETGSYSSIQKTITLTVEVVNGKIFSDVFCMIAQACCCAYTVIQLSCQR